MSTKVVLDDGEGFELYQEVFDPDGVYIRLHNLPGAEMELEPPSFDLQSNTLGTDLRVRIPIAVWDQLRAFAAKDLSKFKAVEDSSEEGSE